jgi:hypothetical protein
MIGGFMKKLLTEVWSGVKRAVVALLLLLLSVFALPGDVFSANLTLTFTAPGDDGDEGTATEYLVFYSTQVFDEFTVDSLVAAGVVDTGHFCPVPDTAGTTQRCFILDLPSVPCWVAIKTADEVPNWSALSNVAYAEPPDVTVPRRIDDLIVDFQ